jgi:hypothetical protein
VDGVGAVAKGSEAAGDDNSARLLGFKCTEDKFIVATDGEGEGVRERALIFQPKNRNIQQLNKKTSTENLENGRGSAKICVAYCRCLDAISCLSSRRRNSWTKRPKQKKCFD